MLLNKVLFKKTIIALLMAIIKINNCISSYDSTFPTPSELREEDEKLRINLILKKKDIFNSHARAVINAEKKHKDAFLFAAQVGCFQALKIAVDNGADIFEKDSNGKTAFDLLNIRLNYYNENFDSDYFISKCNFCINYLKRRSKILSELAKIISIDQVNKIIFDYSFEEKEDIEQKKQSLCNLL